MKPEQANHRKKILKDPVAAYTQEYPKGQQQHINELQKLWTEYQSNNQQRKTIQQQTQQISRKIGEAKREGQSIDAFKQEMQELSDKLKSLAEQLKMIEKQILNIFEPQESNETPNHSESEEALQRVYAGSEEGSHNIAISLLDTEQQAWNDYVENNPAASIYHRAEWRELIHKCFGHETCYFLARDTNNAIVGVLPLVRLKSRLFGDFQVSMPYFNYGGAVADHPLIEQQLMAEANQYAKQRGISHIEYRDDIPRKDLPARTDKVNMVLPLPSSEEELWQGFTPKLRAQIKRPQREAPEVLLGGKDLLDDFYAVFARNMRDLGTPVYGKSFFLNILSVFTQESHILIIRLNGRPVGAAFLIAHRDTLEIPWASTLKEINHLSMNMLMYWEVLRFAIKTGCQYFDFGRSSKGAGTYRFKQQWGAKPKALFWHYWLSDEGELPALNPSNPKYALMIYIWQRLPLMVTNWLGPKIVKNLP